MPDGAFLRVASARRHGRARARLALVVLFLTAAGCVSPIPVHNRFAASDPALPREQSRSSLATYRVMPPDVLEIDAVYNVRAQTMRLRSGDQLTIRLLNGLPLEFGEDNSSQGYMQLYTKAPELQAKVINGPYTIGADGAVDLGAIYGKVVVAGLRIDEAKAAIAAHLHDRHGLNQPQLSVALADLSGRQVIGGQHLVRPDGTVGLGAYGEVYVANATLAEVRHRLEVHLSQYLNAPVVSVDVLAYNSKVYYIIMDGGGYGQQIVRLPCTGNETVLDSIAQINGLPQVSSKRIWVARPCPKAVGMADILRVDWQSITADGDGTTNYQILPGDRIYVQADNLISTDNFVAKIVTPINRVLGTTLLGIANARGIQNLSNGGTSGSNSGF